MGLILAIVLGIILLGMFGDSKYSTNKANQVMAQKDYPENQELENDIKQHLYEEFGKINREPDYISPDIPKEFQPYFKSLQHTTEDVYLFVQARTKEILYSQHYKPFGEICVCSYNVYTGEIIDKSDPEYIYGTFNAKVLPSIRAFNNDYTQKELDEKKKREDYVKSISKLD